MNIVEKWDVIPIEIGMVLIELVVVPFHYVIGPPEPSAKWSPNHNDEFVEVEHL